MGLSELLGRLPRGDLWVFGYGSLMWAPGFRAAERSVAVLHGYHRALCILSHRHRGTPQKPGLVMGLCRGGSCWGMALRVPAPRARSVLARLWHREMRNRVYEPRLLPVRVGARRVRALAFVADPDHPQFVRELDLHGRARLVAQGIGERGRCLDYIRNTLAHMGALGVRDPHLERVLRTALELGSGGLSARPARAASAPAPRRGARAACRN
ncbi:MAG: gamma-glutamylcyclotransferase [Betaproteobacteria bacterium]|nr:gamma-glutamylcyclotransferase [Betaproteobacteria bacterium]